MPLPHTSSTPADQLPGGRASPSSSSQRRPPGRDAPKSMLSRKPPPDPTSRKPAREPPRSAAPAPKPAPAPPPPASSKPPPPQEKKGFWSWRPWGSSAPAVPADTPRRLHVLYSLQVHSLQNLPSALDGLRLIVHWNRQEEGLQTMPARVHHGVVEFDEMLRQRCSVSGTRKSNNLMQYEPKLFQLSVVALDVDELELGKHHVDLSRLLPEEDAGRETKQADRSWSTSFELSGIAKGGSLWVTFSYDLLHQETSELKDVEDDRSGGRMPANPPRGSANSSVAGSDRSMGGLAGIVPKKAELQNTASGKAKTGLSNWSESKKEASDKHLDDDGDFKLDMEPDLDDEVDLVAGEFLNMLDFGLSPAHSESEGEPDSPRARLLKQFEYEGLFGGELDFMKDSAGRNEHGERYPGGSFDFRLDSDDSRGMDGSDVGLKFASHLGMEGSELRKTSQGVGPKSRAQELEDEETQSLMQRWGMDENAFRSSPSKPVFGPPRPPSLGKGLGSVVFLEDGGSLRSIKPPTVSKSAASGSLVMQSSKPVVVPATMGTNAVDILRNLASLGVDTLAKQAMTAMPLQDISGVTDADLAKNSSHPGRFPAERGRKSGYDDYVSLEDLAPMAMPNIEALAVDGLKIQADVAEEEAPSYLDAATWGVQPAQIQKAKASLPPSHDIAAMRFENMHFDDNLSSDVKASGPLSMALTLEEWSKLDAGIVGDDEKSKERSLAIMAAHTGDLQLVKGKGHSRKQGNMGSTLMIAVLVQLRDPLQNFEAVGAPMLTLIQAERVMLPPKPRMGRNVSVTGNSEVDDELPETMPKEEETPQFKLTGVHMSGLTASEEDIRPVKSLEAPKRGWGNQKQVQSGSRWLAAQGMSKGSKPSLLKGKMAPAQGPTTKVKQGETLWSISARVNGSGRKWKELAALNPHIRNPDVIFPNESIRTSMKEDMEW